MRLVEFSNTVVDDVETVLRNLQGQVDAQAKANPETPPPGPITYEELSILFNPMGYGEMNYRSFDAIAKQMKKDDPETFDELISGYDSEGVTLNTTGEEKPETNLTPNTSAGKSVDQMARNVVRKELS